MNILLVVSGSISCYKAYDLLRIYIKNNHKVKVVLTKGCEKFIRPELFSYLGALQVFCSNDDFSTTLAQKVPLHISLARWCNRFIVSPMSAGLLSRFTLASATDLAANIFLALDQKKVKCFYPAMNTNMLDHPFIQIHLKQIGSLQNTFIHPTDSGTLACGEIGAGKLPPIDEIFYTSICFNSIADKNILIVTGATLAQIDPIRFITNPSSGLTGFHLALEALRRNCKVTVLAGKYATSELDFLLTLPKFTLKRLETTDDLFNEVKNEFKKCDYYLSPAAISDIATKTTLHKIKKEDFGNNIPVSSAPDILAHLIKHKQNHQKLVGFAAESDLTIERLLKKYKKKPVDFLIGTQVHQGNTTSPREGFQNSSAYYKILKKDHSIFSGHLKKAELAQYIFSQLDIIQEDTCFN